MERKRDVDLLRQETLSVYRENLNVSSEEMERRINAMFRIQASQYGDEKVEKKK